MQKKILVVDDSASMRKVLEMMLKKSGAEVVLAGSGDEALKKFDPDTSLIISDYYMPAMSGIDFIKAIRSGAVNHNVPILILTTERSPELVAEGRTAGASGWINKPVRQDVLIKTVDRFLNKVEF